MKVRLQFGFIILLLLIACYVNAQAPVEKELSDKLRNCWRVRDILHGKESALTQQQIREFPKKTICFNDSILYLFIDTIYKPTYNFEIVKTKDLLWLCCYSDKSYIKSSSDTLIEISVDGYGIIETTKEEYPISYEFYYDGSYLILFHDGAVIRLHLSNRKAIPNRVN